MSYLPSTDWEPTPGASGAAGNTTPKTLFYISDVRGSAIGLLGADGSVSARYHYDEFGVTTDTKKFDLNWAGPDNLFGYTGLGYDFNSGYSYARARYIDSEVGRFISEDTYEGELNNPQTLNLYTYVSNNPLRYMDPSGHMYTEIGTNYAASDRQAIKDYQYIFNMGKQENDVLIMHSAHLAANSIRLKYESTIEYTNYLYNISYGTMDKDRYLELTNGSAIAVPLWDDPLFYVFDGTFAVAYKTAIKLGGKALGKKSVEQSTEYLLKLFSKSKPTTISGDVLADRIAKVSLGRGSTGRQVANNLNEQLAMTQVLSNPLKGATQLAIKMNDTTHNWLAADGWVKMQNIVKLTDVNGKSININIHFIYNTMTKHFDDFKFK